MAALENVEQVEKGFQKKNTFYKFIFQKYFYVFQTKNPIICLCSKQKHIFQKTKTGFASEVAGLSSSYNQDMVARKKREAADVNLNVRSTVSHQI